MAPEVVVHHLAQAKAALCIAGKRSLSLQLRSAPHAASAAGVGYLQSLSEAVDHEILIDCADDAGLVMAALRSGCRKLIFIGPEADRQRLEQMASMCSASLFGLMEPSPPCLVLSPDDDEATIRDWLDTQDLP